MTQSEVFDYRPQITAAWNRVPVKFRRFVKRQLPTSHAVVIEQWRPGESLGLLGPTRSLKTTSLAHLVARLCREALGDALVRRLILGFYWVRADDIIAAGGRRDDLAAERLIDRATTAPLLVLDDIASCSKTLHRVLQLRYDKDRQILFTSGALNDADLMERIGGEAPFRWIMQAGERGGQTEILTPPGVKP